MKKVNAIIAASVAAALLIGSLTVIATETKKTEATSSRRQVTMTEEEKAERKAKMQEKAKEMLAEQLKNGKITQEQYDQQIAKIENGEFEFGKRMNANRKQLTDDEKAQMKAKMQEQAKERLAEQLKNGKITQEQYDQQIAKIKNGEFEFGRGFGKGRGRRGGFQKTVKISKKNTDIAETK